MPEDEQILSAGDNGPRTELGNLVTNVGGRIQEILDTAERVAGEIRAETEAAGATYLQQRQRDADRIVQERMAELDAITQSLASRASSMEREVTAFVAEVEQVRWRMARLIGDDGASPVEPVTGLRQPPDPGGRPVSDVAALRATQMAVAGAERSEIESVLREEFGIQDASALDGILQPGGA